MEEFMRLAIKEAEKFKRPKQVGAVIVKDGKVIASAHSLIYEENDPTQHAELIAISKAAKALNNKKLEGCTIYSTCEPCMMCTGAILWARIPEVVYGMSRQDAIQYFEHSNFWHKNIAEIAPPYLKITSGVLREECIKAFV